MMSNLRVARHFVAVGYSRQSLRRGFTISRTVADDPDTSRHNPVNNEPSNRPGTSDRFVPWSQHMQLTNRVSGHDNDMAMIKMQYEFLNKRLDGLEKRFETVDRRLEAMDRKMTTWFLVLMGLVVFNGGFDFFSDKNRAGK